jgi:hypothetical protein
VRDGHHPRGESRTALALAPERATTPHHQAAQLALGVVVCRLDAFPLDEGPQRRLMLS